MSGPAGEPADGFGRIQQDIEELALVLRHLTLSPLEKLATTMDTPAEIEALQRARTHVRARAHQLAPRPRPDLGTWRFMRGKKGEANRKFGYLLAWIEPEDVDGHNVLVLPPWPDAEPVASCWQVWTEPVDALTSLAIEGMLLDGKTPAIVRCDAPSGV